MHAIGAGLRSCEPRYVAKRLARCGLRERQRRHGRNHLRYLPEFVLLDRLGDACTVSVLGTFVPKL
jgi:hypothetical protein